MKPAVTGRSRDYVEEDFGGPAAAHQSEGRVERIGETVVGVTHEEHYKFLPYPVFIIASEKPSNTMSEMDKLSFLVGRWRGRSTDQFGEKGVLESTSECTWELGDRFLEIRGETRKDGVVLNQAIDFMTYDPKVKKYIRKRMWSYGFIENGEGQWEDDKTIVFQITYNNAPLGFEGTLWKSFIRRYSNNEIGHGLFTAKKGEEYRLYGETRAVRVER